MNLRISARLDPSPLTWLLSDGIPPTASVWEPGEVHVSINEEEGATRREEVKRFPLTLWISVTVIQILERVGSKHTTEKI